MKPSTSFTAASETQTFPLSAGRRSSQPSENAPPIPTTPKQVCKTGKKQPGHPYRRNDHEACVIGEAERPQPPSEKPEAD
ncbi:MAG: hypothetical protein JWR74_2938 [Polaromonas sp.]|nr:hypothetical protein [Polaromonas sp.]